ncbi:unnamed protein product [Ascophyllum nodosum]
MDRRDGDLDSVREQGPATRLAVITLQEKLDKNLQERQALETGICPVREDLYTQAFDELIRQVTLDSPERGLLCLRVRDEIRMTIDAYKTLFDSSVTFGIRSSYRRNKEWTRWKNRYLAWRRASRSSSFKYRSSGTRWR